MKRILRRLRLFIINAQQEEALAEFRRGELLELDARKIKQQANAKLRDLSQKRYQLERSGQALLGVLI